MGAFAKKPSGDAPSGSLASGSGTVLHESTNAAPPTKPACVPTLATGSAAGHRCGDLQIGKSPASARKSGSWFSARGQNRCRIRGGSSPSPATSRPAGDAAAPLLSVVGTIGGPDELNGPTFVATLPTGGVCIADTENDRLRVATADGVLIDTLGVGKLRRPRGVAVDDAAIYVAEVGSGRLQKLRLPEHLRVAGAQTPRGSSLGDIRASNASRYSANNFSPHPARTGANSFSATSPERGAVPGSPVSPAERALPVGTPVAAGEASGEVSPGRARDLLHMAIASSHRLPRVTGEPGHARGRGGGGGGGVAADLPAGRRGASSESRARTLLAPRAEQPADQAIDTPHRAADDGRRADRGRLRGPPRGGAPPPSAHPPPPIRPPSAAPRR